MVKKVIAYTIETELIDWINKTSKAEDRSASYIVNRAIENERKTKTKQRV